MKHLLFLLTAFSLHAADPVPLFNGKDLSGWTTVDGKPMTAAGWVVDKDGVLHRAAKGGDLYTAKEYADFEFSWEWKIAPGGNAMFVFALPDTVPR